MLEFQILKSKRFTNSALSFWVSAVPNSIGKLANYLYLSTFNFALSADAQSIANVLQQFSTSLPQPRQLLFPAGLFIYFEEGWYRGYIIVPAHSSSTENWREQYLNHRCCYEHDKPQVPVWQSTWAPDPGQGCSETSSGFTLPGMSLLLFIAGWLHEKKSIWHFKIYFLGYIGLSSCC